MIKELYKKYFQKSYNFLFPLLEIKRHKLFKPKQTYISWKDLYNVEDRKLICVYKRSLNDEWIEYEKKYLINHKMLEYCYPLDDENIVYVFDLNIYKEDFDNFLRGKYSKFSNTAKQLMTNYFGINTPEWIFIESYIFPENYFSKYAEILGVDVEDLISIGELCDIYNSELETCQLEVQVNLIKSL